MVLGVKLMSRTARLAPLSAPRRWDATAGGGADEVVVDMKAVEQVGRRGRVGPIPLDPGDSVVVAG